MNGQISKEYKENWKKGNNETGRHKHTVRERERKEKAKETM